MTVSAEAERATKGQGAVQRRSLPTRFVPRFWETVDNRLAAVKEIKARVAALEADTGADSEQKKVLVQRLAFMTILAESREIDGIVHGKLDVGSYVQLVNGITGLAKSLGLNKHARPVEDLRSYIARRTAERQDGAEEDVT